MTRKEFVGSGAVLLLLARTSGAQKSPDPWTDVVAGGKARINYGAGLIKATGYGVPPPQPETPAQGRLLALGAARADALRNLAMAISSIQVTATTQVKNYITQNDQIETRISVVLQGARVVSENTGRDGTAVVVVEVPLFGPTSVAAALLPALRSDKAEEVSAARESRPTPILGRRTTLTLTPESDSGPFTALVIDCRGLALRALLHPRLFDTVGKELFSADQAALDEAIAAGIVGYPRSVQEALQSPRTGNHPLVLRAARLHGESKHDVEVRVEDGQRLVDADQRDHFLARCRVLLLCDP